jgi:excisionase family DNA binding protein
MTEFDPTEWLTIPEVAANLKVDPETVRRWIRAGELPYLSLGSAKAGYRDQRADLDRFTEERYRIGGEQAKKSAA